MTGDELTEFHDMARSAERYDMTMQDPPQMSGRQLAEMLASRLQAEGLSIEDLPMVDNASEFNQVLTELGFSSAVERMAIRKAIRELRDAPAPRSRAAAGRPAPPSECAASDCGARLIEDIGGTGAGQRRRRSPGGGARSPIGGSGSAWQLGSCSERTAMQCGASEASAMGADDTVDDLASCMSMDAAPTTAKFGAASGAGHLPSTASRDEAGDRVELRGRGGLDAIGSRERGGSAGGFGGWLCPAGAVSPAARRPSTRASTGPAGLPAWADQELDGSSEYAKVFMRFMDRGGRGQSAGGTEERGRSTQGAGRMLPISQAPPHARGHPARGPTAASASPPPARSSTAAAASAFGVHLRPVPPRIAPQAAPLVWVRHPPARCAVAITALGPTSVATQPRVVRPWLPGHPASQARAAAAGYRLRPRLSAVPAVGGSLMVSAGPPSDAPATVVSRDLTIGDTACCRRGW